MCPFLIPASERISITLMFIQSVHSSADSHWGASSLETQTSLYVKPESSAFLYPQSEQRTRFFAEIIPWVPLGECRPIHVSKVAASLKVDNQSLCDANRQSSQQTLSPAAQALQLSCMAVKTVDYLGWIDHHRLLVNQSANMTKHSIILLFKMDFTDLDGIPPAHQDCRDDHKRGRKSLSLKQQCFKNSKSSISLHCVAVLYHTHFKSMFYNQYIHKIQTNQGRKERQFIFFPQSITQANLKQLLLFKFFGKGRGLVRVSQGTRQDSM